MPLVPLALERQGADKLTIGIVAAAWAIGMLAFGAHIPQLAARFGAVPLIVVAVVAGSARHGGLHADRQPRGVVRAQPSCTASIGGVPWVVSEIWMNVVVEEKRRGRVMGVYAMLVALGLALGPLVLQVVGVYGPAPFLTCAALALLVAVPLLPYWKTRAGDRAHGRQRLHDRRVAAPLAMFAGFACGLGEQVAFSFLPVYAVGAGVSAETGALWLSAFVIGNVILQWPIGWMADHIDRRAVLAGCTLASAASRRAAADGAGAVAGGHRRRAAVGRHFLRDLSGRAGAARPALQRRRHRPRQHRLQHALHPGRPDRPAAHGRGDGCGRRSRPRLDARRLLCSPRPWPPCWRSAAAADNSAANERHGRQDRNSQSIRSSRPCWPGTGARWRRPSP